MLTLRQKMDVVHRAWRYRLKTERVEIALVRDLISPGDIVLDIGAHKGAFSYWMAKSVGKQGRVLAFEPIPELVEYLNDVSDWLNLNIDVYGYALSDKAGRQKIYFPGHHMGSATLNSTSSVFHEPIEIPKRVLDEVLLSESGLKPISFIKCDVEQHENSVLRGSLEILKRDRPILLTESGNLVTGRETNKAVFDLLGSIGFEGLFVHRNKLVRLSDYDPAKHEVDVNANQNFVFYHRKSVTWENLSRPFRISRK